MFRFLSGLFLVIIAGSAALGLWVWSSLPDVAVLAKEYPIVIYRGPDEPPLVELKKDRPPGWVSLGSISRPGQGAIVVSEDWAFFQHEGYDPNQIQEAFKKDWERGKFSHGASTITQQVVRNVFLTKEKSIIRKLKELYLARKLNDTVSKRRVLEVYLNIAEWGEGIFGIGPAARLYFSKTPDQLTAREGAFLAMLLPSPTRYGQSFRKHELTPYSRKIVNSVLEKMVQAQYLPPEELNAQRSTPFSFEDATSSALTAATKPSEGKIDDVPPPDDATDPDPDPEDAYEPPKKDSNAAPQPTTWRHSLAPAPARSEEPAPASSDTDLDGDSG
jgi:monofunctional biosynthetic peptidoglycan transglycosylase